MVSDVLIDTSYLIGWHRITDELHPRAELVRETLEKVNPPRHVLDCVFSELIAVHARIYAEEENPREFLKAIRKFGETYRPYTIEMACIGGMSLLDRAVLVCEEAAENGVCISPHDAMLLLYAQEKGIKYIISFAEDLGKVEEIGGRKVGLIVVNDRNREILQESEKSE